MKLGGHQALNVFLGWSENDVQTVGRLLWRDRQAHFEYSDSYLNTGAALSPFKLASRTGVISAELSPFQGMFGVFEDSLPDGWGRLLQDRKAVSFGYNPAKLTPIDRLAWVGKGGLGALFYEPELPHETRPPPASLDQYATQAAKLLGGHSSDVLPELLRLGGSPHGTRPKVLIQLRPSDGHIDVGSTPPTTKHIPVLVKFNSSGDGVDMGAMEYAYNQLAAAAGIEVPRAWLLPSTQGGGWFAVERFDVHRGHRKHTHTLSGLLHADHRLPSLDYVGALTAVQHLTKDHSQLVRLYRRMVFNVAAHNRDDHTKQTTLCMNRQGQWSLSPAYDITFSQGPGGAHSMSIAGTGEPNQTALLEVARQCGIRTSVATQIIKEVDSIVCEQWLSFAEESGVRAPTARRIRRSLGIKP